MRGSTTLRGANVGDATSMIDGDGRSRDRASADDVEAAIRALDGTTRTRMELWVDRSQVFVHMDWKKRTSVFVYLAGWIHALDADDLETTVRAVRELVETGELPSWVRWLEQSQPI